jgi:phosphoglycolate phosphatase
MRLALFDIDGTLLLTAHAGMRAFSRAMNHIFDIPADYKTIRPDGKTDPLIARELLTQFGRKDLWQEPCRHEFYATYLDYLGEEMDHALAEGSLRILPGVVELLAKLATQSDFALGLVTGNIEEGAWLKLKKAGLTGYFSFGGFGSDSEDRTLLIQEGIRRGAQKIAPAEMECAIVLGDTPLDIIHGHRAGARVIAVASANYSLDDLRTYDPDLLLPNLCAGSQIIDFMSRVSPG